MSKNLFETYEVNGRQYTDNLPKNALISIPKKQYIEYEQQREEIERLQEEIKGLNAELELYKDNQIHLINQLELKLKENDYFDLVDKSYIKKYLEILDKVQENK